MDQIPVDKFSLPMDVRSLSLQIHKLPLQHSYPPTLLVNTNYYLWGKKILGLPANVVTMSLEGQEGFIKSLRHLEVFSFRNYHPSRSAETSERKWKRISKNLPPDPFSESVSKIIHIIKYIMCAIVIPYYLMKGVDKGFQIIIPYYLTK